MVFKNYVVFLGDDFAAFPLSSAWQRWLEELSVGFFSFGPLQPGTCDFVNVSEFIFVIEEYFWFTR